MNSWNPIRRFPLKKRPQERKESMPWRRKKVRLSGTEMGQLRQEAFLRSRGQCENSADDTGKRCENEISWGFSNLAHIVSRGQAVGRNRKRPNDLSRMP